MVIKAKTVDIMSNSPTILGVSILVGLGLMLGSLLLMAKGVAEVANGNVWRGIVYLGSFAIAFAMGLIISGLSSEASGDTD